MTTRKALSRRTLLRGLGASVALPFLDAMTPALASSTMPGGRPNRMAFVYVPNGIDMRFWNPDYEGKLRGELPATLAPLEPLRDQITMLSNLTHNNGRALLDGAGDHARCCASYLTGIQPYKSAAEIRLGVSCDQIVANQIGAKTRFPSLEIGIEDARQAGNCDSGYSCAYTNSMAWRSESQPLPPVLNPRDVFERLFGKDAHLSPQERAERSQRRRSILDFVADDARKLQGDLGPSDRRKLDEYLSSIRQVETQLEKAEADEEPIEPGIEKPWGIPSDFAEHFRLMADMVTIAFQADLTRVMTFLVTREGSSRPYREIGIPDGHHPLTHHQGDPVRMEKVTKINLYQMQQFAAWMQRLAEIPEGDGSLLDNAMFVYGAGLSDGNRHTHDDLPTLLVGRGAGHISPGRRIVYRKETPMSNLFLTMMDSMGVRQEHFGDSTGRVAPLNLT